jgi:hypothetical protein
MIARYALGIVALLASAPALAQSLDAAAAQRFVLGKLFTFTCVDGSRGSGRVFDDGSVIGTIQLGGRDRITWCGYMPERSRSKATRFALRLTAFRLSHALISTKRTMKVSAAPLAGRVSPIAILPTARTAIEPRACSRPNRCRSIRRTTNAPSSAFARVQC